MRIFRLESGYIVYKDSAATAFDIDGIPYDYADLDIEYHLNKPSLDINAIDLKAMGNMLKTLYWRLSCN